MKQQPRKTKEQAAMKRLDPSIKPAAHDRAQYKMATFFGRGRKK